ADEFSLEVCRDAKHGIAGTRATVRLKESPGHHRHLSDIEKIIRAAGYPERVTQLAEAIFRHVAEAEAKIHDRPINEVHFHEVGATDSIVDIVAAALCFDALNVRHVYCKTLELGGGMVRCAHGLMPVPAPATAEILTGVPCRYDGIDQEATTPTGAAILKELVQNFEAPVGFEASSVGYGVGQKDFEIPNVLRVMVGHLAEAEPGLETEINHEIHCNIDDMTAEAFQPLMEQLLDTGAKDVYLTPIIMKKGRPATKVSVLCPPALTEALQRILLTSSTTIGVRIAEVSKRMLPREVLSVETSAGSVTVKVVRQLDGGRRWKIEHDDIARLAAEVGTDYLSMSRLLNAEVAAELEEDPGEKQ
ncbi:MAG: nickel pincer cofactor biosynthesis protein LarC, partial [Gammaproteobacteria bacterium]